MSSKLPLANIRVLDLSRILAAPFATQYMADLGAEVIKIERPGTGDDTRGWGPPFAVEPTADDPGLSAYFMAANRGKRSVALDIADSQAQEIVRRIAAKSDVMIENFKVGGLVKYGLDHATIRKLNPRIVYCSLTGFGQTGPDADRAGYDFMIQGLSGLMSITGEPDGVPGGGPVKVGVAITDVLTGFNAVTAILAALYRRTITGEGDYIDVALLDCTIAALVNQASTHLVAGTVPTRMGNAHPTVVPYQVFETADGHLILAAGNDSQFARFCRIAGLENLPTDERYTTNAARIRNRDTLIPLIAAAFRTRTRDQWLALLEPEGVPAGPIRTIAQALADPQVRARNMIRTLSNEQAGPLPVIANPVRMASVDTTSPLAPPMLGQDTEDVLRELAGLGPEDLTRLKAKGAI